MNNHKQILNKIKKNTRDYWLWARLSYDYFEEQQYDKALKAGKKAYSLASNEPVVMWDYARALYMNKGFKESSRLLKSILKKDTTFIARHINNADVTDFINTCRFDLALCYIQFDKYALALILLQKIMRQKASIKETYYSTDTVRQKHKTILDTQKEILSKKPKAWISFLEIKKMGENKKGFTNALAMSPSSKKAFKYFKEQLKKDGYLLVKAEGTELYKKRILKSVVGEELRTLADSLKKESDTAFGSFYMYPLKTRK